MNKIILLFTIVFYNAFVFSQNCNTNPITILDQSVKETSGLIFFDGKLVTHNDSGDSARLYEIDTITGNVLRIVNISNATNIDWEDITHDSNYIYVGDFGNNYGNRTDLVIYRISKQDFNSQTNVLADSLVIEYSDQTNFNSQPNANNYDCEAMIAFKDSLMLFSKNWENEKTYLYTIPKIPGNYNLTKRDSFDTQGTITGATYNKYTNVVLLIGYKTSSLSKYMWELYGFEGYNVFGGNKAKCDINITGSIQIEGITTKNDFNYFISSEEINRWGVNLSPYLSSYSYGGVSINRRKRFSIELYPNPVNNILNIFIKNVSNKVQNRLKITNTLGEVVFNDYINENKSAICISKLPKGTYFVSITNNENVITKIFIKN